MFKIGDKVKCINVSEILEDGGVNFAIEGKLALNGIYTVQSIQGRFISLHESRTYYQCAVRFKLYKKTKSHLPLWW